MVVPPEAIIMKCQNGHAIVSCWCGGSACPGYVHVRSRADTAGHYCQCPASGAWVKIQAAP